MKRTLFLLLLCTFLVSCSKNHSSDEYFIHAVGFTAEKEKLYVIAVCEKQSHKQDSDYILIRQKGKDLDSITKRIKEDYENCYFATSELYYFSDSLSIDAKKELSTQLIQSNVYPLRSKAIVAKHNEIEIIMSQIKTEDDLKKAIKKHENEKNVVSYLADFTEGVQ